MHADLQPAFRCVWSDFVSQNVYVLVRRILQLHARFTSKAHSYAMHILSGYLVLCQHEYTAQQSFSAG